MVSAFNYSPVEYSKRKTYLHVKLYSIVHNCKYNSSCKIIEYNFFNYSAASQPPSLRAAECHQFIEKNHAKIHDREKYPRRETLRRKL